VSAWGDSGAISPFAASVAKYTRPEAEGVSCFFVDTNVLLSFYATTQDDLTRLERLADEVDADNFKIVTTSQVRDEFFRTRASKIAEALKPVRNQRLDLALPRICDPYDETQELRRLAREYSALHGQLLARIAEDSRKRVLAADHLIERIFNGAEVLDRTDEIVARARRRMDLGNPPGKDNKIGDAVNWELLLDHKPTEDVVWVTNDRDFYSSLDDSQPDEFLQAEWADKVGTSIDFVRYLSQLPASVPREALPVEEAPDERDEVASSLLYSGSFDSTHRLVATLRRFPQFTPRQMRDLVAALDNSQVGWIMSDEDVFDFYRRLRETHGNLLDDVDLKRLTEAVDRAQALRDEWETQRTAQ
jgi:hypothetical protein